MTNLGAEKEFNNITETNQEPSTSTNGKVRFLTIETINENGVVESSSSITEMETMTQISSSLASIVTPSSPIDRETGKRSPSTVATNAFQESTADSQFGSLFGSNVPLDEIALLERGLLDTKCLRLLKPDQCSTELDTTSDSSPIAKGFPFYMEPDLYKSNVPLDEIAMLQKGLLNSQCRRFLRPQGDQSFKPSCSGDLFGGQGSSDAPNIKQKLQNLS